jgi:hypothetical protein
VTWLGDRGEGRVLGRDNRMVGQRWTSNPCSRLHALTCTAKRHRETPSIGKKQHVKPPPPPPPNQTASPPFHAARLETSAKPTTNKNKLTYSHPCAVKISKGTPVNGTVAARPASCPTTALRAHQRTPG